MFKRSVFILAPVVIVVLLAAWYLALREFRAFNRIAEKNLLSLLSQNAAKDQLLMKLKASDYAVWPYWMAPDKCVIVYRNPSSKFDVLYDHFLQVTDRGSAREIGIVCFDSQDMITSYSTAAGINVRKDHEAGL